MTPTARSIGIVMIAFFACSGDAIAAPPHLRPIDPGRLLPFAQRFERAVNDRDAEAINRAFDMPALTERILRGVTLTIGQRRLIRDMVTHRFDMRTTFAGEMGEDAGVCTLLEIHEVNGRPRALYRVINENESFDYYDFIPAPTRRGGVAFVDLYKPGFGELFSDYFRRQLLEQVGAADAMAADQRAISKMLGFWNQAQYAQALRYIERLPRVIREQKVMLILRGSCAAKVSTQEFDRSREDYRRIFPEDAGIDVALWDNLYRNERWEEALDALGRIQRLFYDDPWLGGMKAAVLREQARLELARNVIDKSITREPTLGRLYLIQLSIALAQKDHEQVARCLTTLEETFLYVVRDLTGTDTYAGFVESVAYRKWVARRTTQAKTE